MFDFQIEGVFQQTGQDKVRSRSAGGAAFGRRAGLADVLDTLVRRIRAHVEKHVAFFRRADPAKLADVIFDFAASHHLIEIQTVGKRGHRQAVGWSNVKAYN